MNKTFKKILLVLTLLIITASVAQAQTTPLFYGEVPKGDITSRKNSLGTTDIAIEEVMNALGLVRTGNLQGIVITLGDKKMEFWNGSSVVRSAGKIISLPSNVEVTDGHWWADMASVEDAINQFYISIGKKQGIKFGTAIIASKEEKKETSKTPTKPKIKETKKEETKTTKNSTQKVNETQIEGTKTQEEIKPEPIRTTDFKTGKRPIVVIDAGHGGHDPGASANGLREKDVNLRATKILQQKLESYGIDVRPTRTTDIYLKLAQRTAFANDNDANVFVSLHCNAMPKGRRASGLEYYIMALPSDKDAMRLAIYENKELTQGGADGEAERRADRKTTLLLKILGDMQQNHKIDDSTTFTEALHQSSTRNGIKARKVSQAPFFVLRGAGMPAVLIEMGYLTDSEDATKLRSDSYISKLCDGLASGIVEYIKENPVVK
ncbi:MAG: N-acetylmuramoyl-L-alanine amidase [Synergistaceae bacterium]